MLFLLPFDECEGTPAFAIGISHHESIKRNKIKDKCKRLFAHTKRDIFVTPFQNVSSRPFLLSLLAVQIQIQTLILTRQVGDCRTSDLILRPP